MITIRTLNRDEYRSAMSIRLSCFHEETGGLVDPPCTLDEVTLHWTTWMDAAEQDNDIRITIAAFDDDVMIAVAAASFSEETELGDIGIELNGLWVDSSYRGRGLSIRLISELIALFSDKDIKHVVVYNYRCAPSNKFYPHIGFSLLKSEIQTIDSIDFTVDIFYIKLDDLHLRV